MNPPTHHPVIELVEIPAHDLDARPSRPAPFPFGDEVVRVEFKGGFDRRTGQEAGGAGDDGAASLVAVVLEDDDVVAGEVFVFGNGA